MAIFLNADQLKSLQKNQEIPGMKGIIKLVWEPKPNPPREPGGLPGVKQGFVMLIIGEDQQSQEFIVTVYDQPAFKPNSKGKMIEVTPGTDGKGKVGGLRASFYMHNDPSRGMQYAVNASKACNVVVDGVNLWDAPGVQAQQAVAPVQRQAPAVAVDQQPAQKLATGPVPGYPAGPLTRAVAPEPATWSEHCAGMEKIIGLAIDTSMRVLESRQEAVAALTGTGWTSEDVLAVANSLIIGGEKRGLPVPRATAPRPQAAPLTTAVRPPAPPEPEVQSTYEDNTDIPF